VPDSHRGYIARNKNKTIAIYHHNATKKEYIRGRVEIREMKGWRGQENNILFPKIITPSILKYSLFWYLKFILSAFDEQ
jgi:hypothetical protein